MFNKISTQDDVQELMKKFGSFHDSCIKELRYISGGYVSKGYSDQNRPMYPLNSKRSVNIIFQSQNADYSVIEMKFDYIQKLNLVPRNEDYDCVIYDASLVKIGDLFYWSEWGDFKIEDIINENRTWISSKEVHWRQLPEEFLGDKLIYNDFT
jgi:hypothetical protein